ncbi:MAG: DUF4935 domain-containing protein [Planctomycetes bacterium]|nr:DUF4935 domain-containing protein [Planctomycetota bacterium]
MNNNIAISDIVIDIEKNSSAVLFLDTCAILDIIRAINRRSSSDMRDAKTFLDKRNSGDINCKIILSSLIQQEYDKHLKSTTEEIGKFFRVLSDLEDELAIAQSAFGYNINTSTPDVTALTNQILSLTDNIINNSIHILGQDNLYSAAGHRAASDRPPAKKGKNEYKDCLIVEECLEICKQLQQGKKVVPLFFLSSNTKDFCIAQTTEIKKELATEFSQYGLEYCYSWQQILSKFPGN